MLKKIKHLIFLNELSYKIYVYLNSNIVLSLKKTPEIKDIVVCGMPRSGSVLLFNILILILKYHAEEYDTFFTKETEYLSLLKADYSMLIKKNHYLSPLLLKRIKQKKTIGFFTHRDIRDVVVSLRQKGWIKDFNSFVTNGRLSQIVNTSLVYAKTKNMNVISYNSLIYNKKKVILQICDTLNIRLTENVINNIINSTTIEKSKKITETLFDGQEYDRRTHLHRGHIADGKTGKWKTLLTPEEVELIEKYSSKFIAYFNY